MLQHFEYNGNNKLIVENGQGLNITGVGNTFVYSLPYYLKLIGVLVVPNIAKNLLSISKLTLDNNVVAEFYSDCCLIKDKQLGVVILKGVLEEGLYKLQVPYCKVNKLSDADTLRAQISVTTKGDFGHPIGAA